MKPSREKIALVWSEMRSKRRLARDVAEIRLLGAHAAGEILLIRDSH